MALPLLRRISYAFRKSDKKPVPADIIEFPRHYNAYSHYGLYVGDGDVVHVAVDTKSDSNRSMSISSKGSTVKREKLWDVAKNNKWIINNSRDTIRPPRPRDDIVREANALVGQEQPYNLVTKNCEHLATKLRYGEGWSEQVDGTLSMAAALPVLALVCTQSQDDDNLIGDPTCFGL